LLHSCSTLTERESLELEDLEAIEITENSSEEDKLNALLFPPPPPKMEQGEEIGNENGSAAEKADADPVPYPPPGSFCGLDQSKKLFLSYKAEQKLKLQGLVETKHMKGQGAGLRDGGVEGRTRKDRTVSFNAVEFLKEKTLMLPVVYSVSAGPHGRGFVRLAEEMNGKQQSLSLTHLTLTLTPARISYSQTLTRSIHNSSRMSHITHVTHHAYRPRLLWLVPPSHHSWCRLHS